MQTEFCFWKAWLIIRQRNLSPQSENKYRGTIERSHKANPCFVFKLWKLSRLTLTVASFYKLTQITLWLTSTPKDLQAQGIVGSLKADGENMSLFFSFRQWSFCVSVQCHQCPPSKDLPISKFSILRSHAKGMGFWVGMPRYESRLCHWLVVPLVTLHNLSEH